MQNEGFLVSKLMFMGCVFGCLWLCGVLVFLKMIQPNW